MKLIELPLAAAAAAAVLLVTGVSAAPMLPTEHVGLLNWNRTEPGHRAPTVIHNDNNNSSSNGSDLLPNWNGAAGRRHDERPRAPPPPPLPQPQRRDKGSIRLAAPPLSPWDKPPRSPWDGLELPPGKKQPAVLGAWWPKGDPSAYPKMTEREDLLRRFEVLECWDLHQARWPDHGAAPWRWECGGMQYWAWRGQAWKDPYDIWLLANPKARARIADPGHDIRQKGWSYTHLNVFTTARRGWVPLR